MFQRDYLMRMIERLAQAIAALIAKRDAGEPAEAEETADQACRDLLGVDAAAAIRLPLETVLDLLGLEASGGIERAEHALLLARLLKEHGETLAVRDQADEARKAWIRAFCLYDEVDKRLGPLPEAHAATLAGLVERLDA